MLHLPRLFFWISTIPLLVFSCPESLPCSASRANVQVDDTVMGYNSHTGNGRRKLYNMQDKEASMSLDSISSIRRDAYDTYIDDSGQADFVNSSMSEASSTSPPEEVASAMTKNSSTLLLSSEPGTTQSTTMAVLTVFSIFVVSLCAAAALQQFSRENEQRHRYNEIDNIVL